MVHDGLFELSGHADKAGFVRVYQYMHNLVDVLHNHWKRDMDILDPILDNDHVPAPPIPELESFVPKLSASSRIEFFGFIRSVRSNPQFLVDRIKSLSPFHLAALTNSLKPREMEVSVVSPFLKHRSSQRKRFEAFSLGLEDYALSFERSNPLSFLLFNVFGCSPDLSSPEYRLRLRTWSSICATLILDPDQQYHAFVSQILNAFATLSVWRARERLELFLMDTLQKGAFLLELAQASPISTLPASPSAPNLNLFGTKEAEDFFDKAVLDLFDILNDQDGGLPESVLLLGRSILGHMKSDEDQMAFRGHIFYQWFFQEFLKVTLTYPEVSLVQKGPMNNTDRFKNEHMLLQCHISREARANILNHLWKHADSSAYDVCRDM